MILPPKTKTPAPVITLPLYAQTVPIFIAQHLPLALGVLGLLGHVLEAAFLDDLFQRYRGRAYEKILDLPKLVQVLGDAILKHGSIHRSLQQARSEQRLHTSDRAFYGKLSRLPLSISLALLDEGTQRAAALLPSHIPDPVPACFAGLQVLLVDGKKSKNMAKRLLVARQQPGKVFGAKLLVCLDARSRLVLAAAACADGERNDNPLVPDLLARLRSRATLPRLFVCDAQFCDLTALRHVVGEEAWFAFRHHPKTHFHPDPETPAQIVTDAKGRRLVQEWGWLGSPKDQRRARVRRVTWLRASATHKDLSVITNLTDAEAYPASAIIDLYLGRWKIETVFQEVATVFGLKHLLASTPEASAFETVLCMLVYNAIQIFKAHLAVAEALTMDDISSVNLFRDVQEEMIAVYKILTPTQIAAALHIPRMAEDMRAWLAHLLAGRWKPTWRKARNKTPRVYGPKPKQSGAHTFHRSLAPTP
jgi:hypothetical protein